MKVRSQHNSKQQKLYRAVLLLVVLFSLSLVIPAAVTAISRVVLYPVYAVQIWFQDSTASLPTFLREKNELHKEIEDLKSQLALAASSDVTQQRLFEENVWLRELLSAQREDRIAAAVIARPNQLPYDFLQVDKGNNDGVQIGAPVYVGIDNVIGVVAHTDDNFSFIELFTTPGFEATSFVSGANITATLEGYGGGVARVRVPQGVSLSIGNVIHVPSIQPGVFGRISYIESQPTQPEQYGYITMSKPIANINYVAIGRETLQPATADFIREQVDSILEQSLIVEGVNEMIINSSSSTDEEII